MLKKLTNAKGNARKTRLMERTAKGVCEAFCYLECDFDHWAEASLFFDMRYQCKMYLGRGFRASACFLVGLVLK